MAWNDAVHRVISSDTVAIYVHIPFCIAKCAYCDFNSYPGYEYLHTRYVNALCREIAESSAASCKTHSLYLGGGTPTVLPPEQIGRIVESVRGSFALDDGAEITIEANPGTVDASSLSHLRRLDINRLSLGVQSFSPRALRLLRRIHTPDDALLAYREARSVGFENINLDLIYGLPYQTLAEWQETLTRAVALGPEHLSLYALSVEPGTPLAEWIVAGEVPAPDPDLAADMYEWAGEYLRNTGYVHYEISNWAREGHFCQHNLTYWMNGPYLGFGAGAHSYRGSHRYRNVSSPALYVERIEAGVSPIEESEVIDTAMEMAETMFLGLRLSEGIRWATFEGRFGRSMRDVYREEIQALREVGLLEVDGTGIRLTPRGRLLGNEVFRRFLPSV